MTRCTKNHKNGSTWAIPVKLVSFDGEFPLVYIKTLVIRVGALWLMGDCFEVIPLFAFFIIHILEFLG